MSKTICVFVAILLVCSQAVFAGEADSTSARRDSVYKQVDLGGVTVEGRTAIQKDDHINYMPTQRQVDASSSGIALLANMMIPKLLVDRFKGTVTNADNSALAIYIDDRKADATEINRLRPKDIVRVEYYDRPSAKFPADQTSLNFITRKYDRGGYVDLRTTTALYPSVHTGSYLAQAGVDTKALNITMLAGASFSKDDAPGTTGTEYYALSTPFTQRTTALEGLSKTNSYFGKLRLTHRSEGIVAYADFGLSWDANPVQRYRAMVDYSPGLYPSSESSTDASSRNVTPSANLFFQRKWAGGREFRTEASYSYTGNTYDRTYTEGILEQPIVTDAKENVDYASIDVNYTHPFGGGKSLGLMLYGIYTGSRATYAGTMEAESGIKTYGLIFYPTYRQTFGKKLSLEVCPGLYWEVYKIRGAGRLSELMARPRAVINYSANAHNSVVLGWSMASNEPLMSEFNSTEQMVNQYMVTRGNPDLGIAKAHFLDAIYNLSVKNVSLSLTAHGIIFTNNVGSHYFVEDDMIVKTLSSDGNYYDCTLGGAVTWSLLKRSLQISGQAYWKGQKLTGAYARNYSSPFFSLSAAYYLKGFSFSAQFISRLKNMDCRGHVFEQPFRNFITASWSHKGLVIEAFCANMLESEYRVGMSADYGVYNYDEVAVYNGSRAVGLNVSYSFDFGRKKVERTKLDVDKGSSGILKL